MSCRLLLFLFLFVTKITDSGYCSCPIDPWQIILRGGGAAPRSDRTADRSHVSLFIKWGGWPATGDQQELAPLRRTATISSVAKSTLKSTRSLGRPGAWLGQPLHLLRILYNFPRPFFLQPASSFPLFRLIRSYWTRVYEKAPTRNDVESRTLFVQRDHHVLVLRDFLDSLFREGNTANSKIHRYMNRRYLMKNSTTRVNKEIIGHRLFTRRI